MSHNKKNSENENTDQKQFVYDLREFHRTEEGTFEEVAVKNGKPVYRPLASHAISISKIFFKINNRGVDVLYELRFRTGRGPVVVRVSHTDLNDEKSFLNIAPPGFSLASIHRAFHKLREMLMLDIKKAKHVAVLTQLGWFRWKGKPIFAHAGGIICSEMDVSGVTCDSNIGTSQIFALTDIDEACSDVPILVDRDISIEEIYVELPEQFSKYKFDEPKSKKEIQKAVKNTLSLLKLGDANVTYITVAAVFFAALRNPRFALFLYGETGSLKTAFAMLLLSFFVKDPQESDLASFKSTENALRARFSASGNVPVVVDDFIEPPGSRQSSPMVQKADNVIRSIVNANGKERAAQDGSLRPNDRPLGLIIVTGEQFPSGLESLKRRTVNVQIDQSCFEEAIQGSRPNRFSDIQQLAADGTFTKSMAAFLAWSAKDNDMLQEYLNDPGHGLKMNDKLHRRLPDAANDILSGMGAFLTFAYDLEVISNEEFNEHATAMREAVDAMLDRAYLESLEDCPTEAFSHLLKSSMSSLNCHIEVEDIEYYVDQDEAIPLQLLGYTIQETQVEQEIESDDGAGVETEWVTKTVYRPHGSRIGTLKNECIDLIPEAALAAANSIANRSGTSILPNKKSFGKNLAAENWIATKDKDRNTCTVRVGSVTMGVWRIHAFRLFEPHLAWGTFDVEYYNEMSAVQRQQEREKQRNGRIQKFRERLANYQADQLLNPHLTEEDRQNLITPDPPEDGDMSGKDGSSNQSKPYPPQTPPIPGHDDMDEHGLLA
ncbi:DUF927 domain-containing protein [Gimesia algae]|uniref:DUF927 domain-containing protein n=1 Tax=Gimesia algae TaxID=2527971 RepID=A0A517VAY8_9PLAN|nr:DUF927 domain-containing protein [Gimesia algae]QDT90175.1 hypothetical protein Pan161_18250 [Gimesia algae]